jgi:hypothetical protein
LSAIAAIDGVFHFVEEAAYSPYGNHCVVGEKAAALLILGQRNPDSAIQLAISRLRDPVTPDSETYVPELIKLTPANAPSILLDLVRQGTPTRIVYTIGRYLHSLGAIQSVLAWLADADVERQLAACRVACFMGPRAELILNNRAQFSCTSG